MSYELNIDSLKVNQIMEGKIQNTTNFGAFVDLGIKESGLIHISNLSDSFVRNPLDVVSIGQTVKVEIISIDLERKRISLKLIQD